MSENNAPRRRRRLPVENAPNTSKQEQFVTVQTPEKTRISVEHEMKSAQPIKHVQAQPHKPTQKPQLRKKKNSSYRTGLLISLVLILILTIAVLLFSAMLFVNNGWVDGYYGLIAGVVSTPTPTPTLAPTPTPTPTPTQTPVPTPTPSPVIEYVYLTPEPTLIPTATPVPTPSPTPAVEYVYLTPEPTYTPSPTPATTLTPTPIIQYIYITPSPTSNLTQEMHTPKFEEHPFSITLPLEYAVIENKQNGNGVNWKYEGKYGDLVNVYTLDLRHLIRTNIEKDSVQKYSEEELFQAAMYYLVFEKEKDTEFFELGSVMINGTKVYLFGYDTYDSGLLMPLCHKNGYLLRILYAYSKTNLTSEQAIVRLKEILESILNNSETSETMDNTQSSEYYRDAEKQLKYGNEADAIIAFKSAGNYRDSEQRWKKIYYAQAERYLEEQQWVEAIQAFSNSEGYKDAEMQIDLIGKLLLSDGKEEYAVTAFEKINQMGRLRYLQGDNYLEKKEYWNAFYTFRQADYEDSLERAYEIGYKHCAIGKIDASCYVSIGLNEDGTVRTTGWNNGGLLDVEAWTEVIAVAATHITPYGLRSDGTVVTTDKYNYGDNSVQSWKDVIAISAGEYHIVGLRRDGTVLATFDGVGLYSNDNRCDVKDWHDIVAVFAGSKCTIGLKSDGTIICTNPEYNFSSYTDVVDIASGNRCPVVMKNGSVEYLPSAKNVDSISGALDIDVYGETEIALKSDGTVYVCTDEITQTTRLRNKTKDWKDIVAVAAGDMHVLGVKKDGSAVSATYRRSYFDNGQRITIKVEDGQSKVSDWQLWN